MTQAPRDDAVVVTMVNRFRADRGIPALVVDPALTRLAGAWANELATTGTLAHDPNLGDDPRPEWIRLGENVGRGA